MSARLRLTVVGDALLDRDVEGDVTRLAPDAPVPVVDHTHTAVRPGGAGLAAVLAAAVGHEVRLVTALADDAAGRELAAALAERGVEVVDLGLHGTTPEKIRVRAGGRALLRLDRGGTPRGRVGAATAAARAAIEWADALLVADYGRGVAASDGLRVALRRAGAPLVWDPHPRGAVPVEGATLITPNEAEARGFARDVDGAPEDAEARGAAADGAQADGADAEARGFAADGAHIAVARAEALRARWGAAWVCVTRGADGAVAVGDGPPIAVTAPPAVAGDPCGAGDRFASRAAEVLGGGGSVPEAIRAAVAAASAFVAAGGAASASRFAATGGAAKASLLGAASGSGGEAAAVLAPRASLPRGAGGSGGEAAAVIARVRAQGGTVVATGGCFDLLHPGHVETLQAARSLGDCLIVCLNSDASVRGLKGPGRPVVGQDDRAAVLLALGCVDAVAIFDEPTPVAILERLRPDLWVKGGDYAARELPEAEVLATWNGRAVVVPLVEGRSTTRLIEEAALHAV